MNSWQELIACRCESYQLEALYARNAGDPIWGRSELVLIGAKAEPPLVLVTLEDISAQKAAREQLNEAQKMESMGRLVGSVAHDFNNLLTGILLYCDLLIEAKDTNEQSQRYAGTIRVAAEHGASLLKQLLTIARKQVVEPQVLSLNQLVASMSDLLTRLVGERICLQFDFAKGLWNVLLDPTQAQQVVLNLVLNARDAMPKGGNIVVTTKNCFRESSESGINRRIVSLAVSDSGCGMDENTKARLFQPFFTTKPRGKGNGLGLATVHRIVQDAGGAISVETAEGKGARIEIVLPGVLEETEDARGKLDSSCQVSSEHAANLTIPTAAPVELTQVANAEGPTQRKSKVL